MCCLNLDSKALPVSGARVLLLAAGGFYQLSVLDTFMSVSVSLISPQNQV
jgi:hypothetical protein